MKNLKKVNILLVLFLVASFFKEMIFVSLVPIWHTPDEQAHFAQVAYFSEFNKMPKYPPDLNREIWESEKLLGTDRDNQGNNKFTYHPEYRIEYTNNLIGKYEAEISKFPVDYRRELIKQEAANYPPLYYWISAIPYKIFYGSDLIIRVFSVRFISILMSLGTIYFAFLISKKLFPKNNLLQLTIPLMVSFQPMFSFVSAGINSDNLMNLLFTVFIYLSILLIDRMTLKRLLITLAIFIAMYLTKPQFMLAIPMFFLAACLSIFLNPNFRPKYKLLMILLILAMPSALLLTFQNEKIYAIIQGFYPQNFFPGFSKHSVNIVDFLHQTLNKTARETIPWYWGVFNWLGVVFPIEVIRTLNRVMIVAVLGLVVKLVLVCRSRNREDIPFLFIMAAALIYFVGIIYYDFLFYSINAFSFGIQGRYFFPTIVSHMTILLVGLATLVPSRFRVLKNSWIKMIGLAMILLNFIGLWTIAGSYYDLSNFNTFIIQASQYKPWFYKGNWLIFWLVLYLGTLLYFLYRYLFFKETKLVGR